MFKLSGKNTVTTVAMLSMISMVLTPTNGGAACERPKDFVCCLLPKRIKPGGIYDFLEDSVAWTVDEEVSLSDRHGHLDLKRTTGASTGMCVGRRDPESGSFTQLGARDICRYPLRGKVDESQVKCSSEEKHKLVWE